MLKEKIRELFSLDYRSLALMRVGIGFVLLLDLFERATSLSAHYTAHGVLPCSGLRDLWVNLPILSLHCINGDIWFQILLFIVSGCLALFMLFGYKTGVATFFSWVILISLQGRNPLVLQGGDTILRIILFWAMFLPWGRKYSVDSLLKYPSKDLPDQTLSAGTVAYIIQISLFYIFNGWLKTGTAWTQEGSAIYYALSIDQFTRGLGYFMLNFPLLLKYLTFFVLYLERFGPLLFFSPIHSGAVRTITILTLIGTQIGINLSMRLGLFGAIAIVTILGLLPSWFWDNLLPRIIKRKEMSLRIYYDSDCGFCKNAVTLLTSLLWLPTGTHIAPASTDSRILSLMTANDSWVIVDGQGREFFKFEGLKILIQASPIFWPLAFVFDWTQIKILGNYAYMIVAKRRSRLCVVENTKQDSLLAVDIKNLKLMFSDMLIILLVGYVILWNIQTLYPVGNTLLEKHKWIGWLTRLDQEWSMFAPYPALDDGWYIVLGRLINGDELNIYQDGPAVENARQVSYEKPPWVVSTFKDQRWHKYMSNLWNHKYKKSRHYYGLYLCHEWNIKHMGTDRLDSLQMIYMLEKTLPDFKTEPVEPTTLLDYMCPKT